MPNQIIIKNKELMDLLNIEDIVFPKYTSQIINLANQNSQGTRPNVVGQLSELIREFPGKTYREWVEWYTSENPEAIDRAVNKISAMVNNLKDAINKIDESMIRRWLEDLIHCKTFIGLKFQEAVLKKIASIKGCKYRLSNPEEESKGIDGFIENIPVSIKPFSYKTKNLLPESIGVNIIYYEKKKTGILIEYFF